MDDSGGLPTQPDSEPTLSRAVILAVLASSAAVAGFAISTQSYWIDEALSLIVAMSSSPTEAWKYMQAVSGSTLQMPLYQLYLFGWHKIFGGGEWAMRASNIPWFILAQFAFLALLRHKARLALLACLLAAVSPILWMYLDETRPYVMQYAAACWLAVAIVHYSSPRPPTTTTGYPSFLIAALPAAVVVLFASSLLGVIWAGAYAIALFYLLRGATKPDTSAQRGMWLAGLLAVALLVGFATYYVFTWGEAARGYHRTGSSLLSLPFIAYELLGFTGFGPGKLEMRAEPIRSVVQSIPALLPLAITLGLLVIYAARHATRTSWRSQAIVAWSLALGLPLVAIFIAMLLFDHRPLPRHFIPALPALLLAIAALMQFALEGKSIFARAVAALLPMLWLGSSLNYRWQPAHAKDNYREAAAVAAAALRDNKEVWWAADPAAAYVYLTPVAMEEVPGRAWAMQAPSWDAIRFKFPPRVIVISKPDIYDPQGAVARYAAENRFAPALQLQAFTIFTREGDQLPETGNP
jgi:uncharacterized membrane protein